MNTYCAPSSGFVRSSLRCSIEPCDVLLKVTGRLNIGNRHGFALIGGII